MRRLTGLSPALGALLAVFALAGCGEQDDPLPEGRLRIATGNAGGVYAAYGKRLAQIADEHLPKLDASAVATDGSVENLRLLQSGDAEVAFTLADAAADAQLGRGPFQERIDVVALARLYDNDVQLIVRDEPRNAQIRRVDDLAGKVISVGARGSGTALIARRVLGLSKLKGPRAPRRLVERGIDASTAALAAGEIDAFFWSGGLPTPAVEDLGNTIPIRLLDLGGVAAQLKRGFGDLYAETTVPESVYGAARPVRTVSVANFLVVRRDFPRRSAYRLTRLLFERYDELKSAHEEAERLQSATAIVTDPLALHPGAEDWYREGD